MRGISRRFQETIALDQVDFDLRAGSLHGLLGENGAGKSTLMKILAGAERPDSGTIRLASRPMELRGPADALSKGIAMIFQELNMAPHLSVAENIFLGDEPSRLGWIRAAGQRRMCAQLLEQLGMALDPDTTVARLSPGRRQMVEIARAVHRASQVLILDEPTSYLSIAESEELFRIIASLRDRGIGMIYITHRLEEVERLADEITVLRDGRLVYSEQLAPRGTSNRLNIREVLRAMVGREIQDFYPSHKSAPGEVLLEVRDLCDDDLLHDVSLEVRSGEIVGLSGLVGSGRTEFAETLFGLRPPRSGTVLLDGQPVQTTGPVEAIRQGMAFLTEDRKDTGILPTLSIYQNLTLPTLGSFCRSIWIDIAREIRSAGDAMTRVRVKADSPLQSIEHLSGGNQQKVLLARWLLAEARLWILDEPTRGIDVAAKVDIYRSIQKVAERGKGILLISSELPEILGICDRVLVFRQGRVVASLRVADTNQEELIRYAAVGP
ncbi:MAG: sugar ABC transporter ATP-binding protein [Acidobacteriota bacterium]